MAILLAVTVLVGLLLPLEQSKLSPSWRRRPRVADGTPGPAPQQRPGQDNLTAEWGLFTEEFVRHRLHALEAELARLDRDPDVFARAFHTLVTRAAYEALLAEARTFREKPRWRVGEVVDAEMVFSSGGPREVLEF